MNILEKSNQARDLNEHYDFLRVQIENYRLLDRESVMQMIKEEIEYVQNINLIIDDGLKNDNLLFIYFYLKIFSNLLENIYDTKDFKTSWKELYYIFIMENLNPEIFLRNTLREIKRKKSYSSKRYINKILSKNLEGLHNHKNKQLKLDSFL